MIRRIAIAISAILAACGISGNGFAVQWAEVTAVETAIHDLPNGTAPVLERIRRGTRLPVSNRMIKDVFGEYWFKARGPSGVFGFVSAKAIRTRALLEAQRDAGLQEWELERIDSPDPNWTFVLRAMVGGGVEVSDGTLGLSIDAEFTFTPFLKSEGYERRKLSAGGFFQLAGEASALGASAVYRIFSNSRLEPEARLRLGILSTADESAFGAGLCVGARYPLSLTGGKHLALYIEGQSFMGFTSPTAVLVSISTGMGLHF